jgi:hypothetical protein
MTDISKYYPHITADFRALDFAAALREAMTCGLGKARTRSGAAPHEWTIAELDSALKAAQADAAFVRKTRAARDGRGRILAAGTNERGGDSQRGNVENWLRGAIPGRENWRAIEHVFFGQTPGAAARAWRDLFDAARKTAKRRRRSALKTAPSQQGVGLKRPRTSWPSQSLDDFVCDRLERFPRIDSAKALASGALDFLLFGARDALGLRIDPEQIAPGAILFALLFNAAREAAARLTVARARALARERFDLFETLDWRGYAETLSAIGRPLGADDLPRIDAVEEIWAATRTLLRTLAPNADGDRLAGRLFRDAFYSGWNDLADRQFFALSKLLVAQESAEADLSIRLHHAHIRESLRTPFGASEVSQGDVFSLDDLYIDVPIFPESLHRQTHKRKTDVEAQRTTLRAVLDAAERERGYVCLGGGPGSGKSTAVRKLLADFAASSRNERACVYIPLQRHGRIGASDARLTVRGERLGGFRREEVDLLDCFRRSSFRRLTLVLDGVDELAIGPDGRDQAVALARLLSILATTPAALRDVVIVVTGRPEAFSRFRFADEVAFKTYFLSPLCLAAPTPPGPRSQMEAAQESFIFDLRLEWIEKYHAACFAILKAAQPSPAAFLEEIAAMDSLTAEPLLLLLLARLRVTTGHPLSTGAALTRNDVYDVLVSSIRHPVHRPANPREGVGVVVQDRLADERFRDVLECMAFCAWRNGTGRVTSIREFLAEAERRDLADEARTFVKSVNASWRLGSDDGLHLLSVFYFQTNRAPDHPDTEIEFTHKSFASFLVATRLFSDVAAMARAAAIGGSFDQDGFRDWAAVLGEGQQSGEIFGFLQGEASRHARATASGPQGPQEGDPHDWMRRDWAHQTQSLRRRPAAPTLNPGALELLIARATDARSRIAPVASGLASRRVQLPDLDRFRRAVAIIAGVWSGLVNAVEPEGEERYAPRRMMIDQLAAQCVAAPTSDDLHAREPQVGFLPKCLCALDLGGLDFSGANLIGGDFSFSRCTQETRFQLAALCAAQFFDVALDGVEFDVCMLDRATFFETGGFSIFNSSAQGCMFERISFDGASFRGVDFSESQFHDVAFRNVDFERVKFADVHFSYVRFDACRFFMCDFSGSRFDAGHARGGSAALCRFDETAFAAGFAVDLENFGEKQGVSKA